jgi:hypothetical protein
MAGRSVNKNGNTQSVGGQGFSQDRKPPANTGENCERTSTSKPRPSATRVEASNAIALANRETAQELGSFLAMGAEAQSAAMKHLAAQAKPLFNGEYARAQFFKHLSNELADTPPEFPASLVMEPVDEIFSLDLDISQPLEKLHGLLHGESRKALPSA